MAVSYNEKRQALAWLHNSILNDEVKITDYQKLYNLVVDGPGISEIKDAVSKYQAVTTEPVSYEKFEDTVMFYAHSLEEILRKDPNFSQNNASTIKGLTAQINNLGNNYIVSHLYNQLLNKKKTYEEELASIKVSYNYVIASQMPLKERYLTIVELLGRAIKKQEEISNIEAKIESEKRKYDTYISNFNMGNKVTDFLRDAFLVNRTLWNMNLSRSTKDAIDNLYHQTQLKFREFGKEHQKNASEIEKLCNAAGLTFSSFTKTADIIKEEPSKEVVRKSSEIKYQYNGIIPDKLRYNKNYNRLIKGATYTFAGYYNTPGYIKLKEVPGAIFSIDSFDKVNTKTLETNNNSNLSSPTSKPKEDKVTEVVVIAPEVNEAVIKVAKEKEKTNSDSLIQSPKAKEEINRDDMLNSYQSIIDEFNSQKVPFKEPIKPAVKAPEVPVTKTRDDFDLYMNIEDLHKEEKGIRDYHEQIRRKTAARYDEFRKSKPNPYKTLMNAMTDDKIRERRNFMIGDQIEYNSFRPDRFVHIPEYQILVPGQKYTFIAYKDNSLREIMLEEIPGVYFSVDSFDLVKTKDNKISHSYAM